MVKMVHTRSFFCALVLVPVTTVIIKVGFVPMPMIIPMPPQSTPPCGLSTAVCKSHAGFVSHS